MQMKKEIEQQEDEYIELLGNLYQDIDTDLQITEDNFKAIQDYINLCQEIGYQHNKFETFVFDKQNLDKIFEIRDILKNSIDIFQNKFQIFEAPLNITVIDSRLISLSDLKTILQEKFEWVNSILCVVQQVLKHAKNPPLIDFNAFVDIINLTKDIFRGYQIIESNLADYKNSYGFLYQGVETDWRVIS